MPTSQQIISQARTWLGTRFHHQGRVKKSGKFEGGVDCIGLVVGVLRELDLRDDTDKLLADYDITGYSMTPDGFTLKNALDTHFETIAIEKIKPADILLFRFHKNPQHVGFVTDREDGELGILHCYSSSKYVVEHHLNKNWRRLIVAAYRLSNIG